MGWFSMTFLMHCRMGVTLQLCMQPDLSNFTEIDGANQFQLAMDLAHLLYKSMWFYFEVEDAFYI